MRHLKHTRSICEYMEKFLILLLKLLRTDEDDKL
ncbi:unnamed protein product [Spirodela intermedia]|uniref:Uncharacterized protein n=2 Tax=Spirodela intermedia TaxID=51605 RepID=A0A7I8IRL9_SPIIN|nr:unnamed protein product [Spirodela intermedia]CAA6660631.1 unnamed protein product [Spirodela intermedia]CAA7391749.1 unnamed protein product [Spirodela intermedia]